MASFAGSGRAPSTRRHGARYNLFFARNVAFDREFRMRADGGVWPPDGWGGYTIRAQVRQAGRRGQLIVDFETVIGGIVVDDDEGSISLHVPQAVVAEFPLTPAEWDLLYTPDGGEAKMLLWGDVEIVRGVTSDE